MTSEAPKPSKPAQSRRRQPLQEQKSKPTISVDLLAMTKVVVDSLAEKIAALESARTQLEARVVAYESDRVNLLAAIETERSARYTALDVQHQAQARAAIQVASPIDNHVRAGRHTPGYFSLMVELVPQANFVWACSAADINPKDMDIENSEHPWHELVARCFEDSITEGSEKLRAPAIVLPYLDLRFIQSPAPTSTIVGSYFGEFDNGAAQSGYSIVVPNDRLRRILTGAATVIRQIYAD